MKKIAVVLLACAILLVLTACKAQDKADERESVSDFPIATIEYSGDKGYKLITSEIDSLDTFDSLLLKPVEEAFVGEWVYRIVFNPSAYAPSGEEFVILFGEQNVSVNGKVYVGDGYPYAEILDWVSAKYRFFDYELIQD